MGYMIKNGVAYAGANSIQLTQAQYDAIVQAGTLDPNALYFITDAQGSLIKRNLTQAEYDALSTAEKNNGTVYFISDSDNMLPAGSVSYDPSVSGLSATDVKSAIDEVACKPITDAVLTCVRCPIASFQSSKCYQIGNVIYYSAQFTFGSTVATSGAIYFELNKVVAGDSAWGTLFYDTGDLIHKVSNSAGVSIWVTNGTTRINTSDVVGKNKMYLNLTIVKA